VSYKTPSSRTRIQISKSEGSIPGTRERKLTVGGNDDVLDKMRVACQTTPRKAVVPLFPSQVPRDDTLVSGGGEDEIGVAKRAGDGHHPARMPLKSPPQHKRLSHNADALLPHRLLSFRLSSPSLSGEAWANSKSSVLVLLLLLFRAAAATHARHKQQPQAKRTGSEGREGLIPQTLNPSRTRLRALKLLGDFGVGFTWVVCSTELLCVSWPSFQANVKWDQTILNSYNHYDKSSIYVCHRITMTTKGDVFFFGANFRVKRKTEGGKGANNFLWKKWA